jgi:hypothetical protein
VAGAPDEERVDDLGHVEHGQLGHGHQEAEGRARAEQDAQAVPGLQPAPVVHGPADRERLEVADARVRGHDHPGPGHVRPPAEAQVVEQVVDALVVATDLGEEVGPHEHERARHHEHVTDGVVLLLVELAPLHQRHGVAGVVDALADLEQARGVVPAHELGPDDRRVGAVRLLHQHPHGVRGRVHVVVAHEEEGGTVDDVEDVVGGRPVAGVVLQPPHEGAGGALGHPPLDLGLAGGVDDQDRQVRVVLLGQGRHRLLEPRPRVARHDHRHHRRGDGRGVGGRVGAVGLGVQDRPTVVGGRGGPGTTRSGSRALSHR